MTKEQLSKACQHADNIIKENIPSLHDNICAGYSAAVEDASCLVKAIQEALHLRYEDDPTISHQFEKDPLWAALQQWRCIK